MQEIKKFEITNTSGDIVRFTYIDLGNVCSIVGETDSTTVSISGNDRHVVGFLTLLDEGGAIAYHDGYDGRENEDRLAIQNRALKLMCGLLGLTLLDHIWLREQLGW